MKEEINLVVLYFKLKPTALKALNLFLWLFGCTVAPSGSYKSQYFRQQMRDWTACFLCRRSLSSSLSFNLLFCVSLNVKRIVSLSFSQTEESNICMYSFININVPGTFSILPELGGSAKGLYSRKTHF